MKNLTNIFLKSITILTVSILLFSCGGNLEDFKVNETTNLSMKELSTFEKTDSTTKTFLIQTSDKGETLLIADAQTKQLVHKIPLTNEGDIVGLCFLLIILGVIVGLILGFISRT